LILQINIKISNPAKLNVRQKLSGIFNAALNPEESELILQINISKI